MTQSPPRTTITQEEFAEYARENNATVIVVVPNDPQPSVYDPQPKGRAERLFQQQRRRDEALAINGFADVDREATLIADWLITRFSGASYGHIKALTERAVEFIGGRVVVADDTVVMPEQPEAIEPERRAGDARPPLTTRLKDRPLRR